MPSIIHSRDSSLYSVSDLLQWQPPPVTRIIDKGIFNVGNKMLIFGDEGSWKSILTIHTAVCLANGTDWFGYSTTQCNLLKIQVELPQYSDRNRIEKYLLGHKRILEAKLLPRCKDDAERLSAHSFIKAQLELPNMINRTDHFLHIDELAGIESLKRNIELCLINLPSRPLVIILDPLYMIVGGDPNKNDDMKRLLQNIDLAVSDYERKGFSISTIIIHHMKKPDVDNTGRTVNGGSNDQSGTRDFQKWADTIIRLDLDINNSKRIGFRFTKHRNAEEDLYDFEIKWNRDTLHPQVTNRFIRHDPKEEDEALLYGNDLLLQLES